MSQDLMSHLRDMRQRGVDFAPQLPQHCFLLFIRLAVNIYQNFLI